MGERVTLTARPAYSWRFVRWDGNASGTDNTTKVTMNMHRTVWAVFESGYILALNVQVQGQGSTYPSDISSYDKGAIANVRANPADGWHFLRWEGDLRSNDSVIQLPMDQSKTVTAVFEEDALEYTLNVEPGTGNVTAYPQSDTYPAGTVVSLIAKPLVQGEHFLRWEADASGNVNAAQIIMDRNKTVEAVFEAEDEFYEFLVTIQGNGAIDYTFFTYQQNRVLDVRALPAPAWHFLRWGGDVQGNDNITEVVFDRSRNLTVVFEKDAPEYTLATSVQGPGNITAEPQAQDNDAYQAETIVTLTAVPDQGHHLVRWEGDAASDNDSIQVAMDRSRVIKAIFEQDASKYALALGVQGHGVVDSNYATYPGGTEITLAASPAGGWYLATWEGNSENDAFSKVTMDRNKVINAMFKQVPLQVTLETTMGNIVIQLDPLATPNSVENFITYVEEGFYDGKDGKGLTIFHRVISGFVIQAGGLLDNMTEKETHSSILSESEDGLKNYRGSVAMARLGTADSATSQFFINLEDNSFLNYGADARNPAGYTVFGKVVQGMDIVDAIGEVQTHTINGYDNVPVDPITITSVYISSSP